MVDTSDIHGCIFLYDLHAFLVFHVDIYIYISIHIISLHILSYPIPYHMSTRIASLKRSKMVRPSTTSQATAEDSREASSVFLGVLSFDTSVFWGR